MTNARAVKTAETDNVYQYRNEAGIFEALISGDFSVYLHGFSALDYWLNGSIAADIRILTSADISDLARLFENLRYPGADIGDAALDFEGGSCYFTCGDSEKALIQNRPDFASFSLLEFYFDLKTRRFYDPREIYPLLRQIRDLRRGLGRDGKRETDFTFSVLRDTLNSGAERTRALMDGALILAKYFPGGECGGRIEQIAGLFSGLPPDPPPREEEQRRLLTGLLTGCNPGFGLELLKNGGFIGKFWPELEILDDVDHSKEFHPEGNAWKHTLETFRYRKNAAVYDLRLSLGLLLHDTGKPIAESSGSRRFDGHAELGERQSRRFLERLGFSAPLVDDVCYLVRNHMFPAALPRLPLIRTGGIMASPLFPTLLELYRCDESSSFKGLDAYYESSAAYQSYLRYRRNPYRSADGKKLNQERQFLG
ncbi:MAG: HD domain-containing protein [Treponema sp.]|jgi:poly(A) polymerase|nr:HD domain-containing protein [Treponema sp.]